MEKTFSRAVAHRGLHGAGVAQNSVESFTAAWAAGARQIETDFFLLENGRILCVHDKRELMRVACEESFRDIAKLTAEDVAAIDIGKLAKTPAPVHMPYLEDVLATVPRDGIAQCEIKLYGAGFADKFDTAVREAGLSEMNILVTSFDDNALADFKLRHPGYDTLWLGAWLESAEGVANLGKAIARAREIGVKYVCPGASGALKAGFTREMADALRASGLDVRLYGVNSPELLQYAADIGATGFTTDHWLDAFEWAKGVRNIVLESRKSTEAASVHVADGVCNVRDFGAKGDGATLDTAAIQAAVDAAAAAGGGEVRLPAGRYLCGSIFLKGGVDFNITAGAVVEASKKPEDYNAWDVCPQNWKSQAENTSGGHLFLCIGQTDVTLRGFGRIEGNGVYFMTDGFDRSQIGLKSGANAFGTHNPQDAIKWRPAQMVYFVESDRIRIQDLEIVNSPYWSVFLHGCANVYVRGLRIHTSRSPYIMNGDGLNIDCCRWVRVSDCDIETSDDSLCLRADGKRLLHAPAETAWVTIDNCILSSTQEGMRIGVGEGRIHDCAISNCVFRDCQRGINFSSTWFPSRGVDFENIRFANLSVECASSFLRIHRLRSTEPTVREIHFTGVHGTQGERSYIRSHKGKPFENITLDGVDVVGGEGVEVLNVNGFRLGGAMRQIELSPADVERLNADVDAFRNLLY